MLKEIRKLYLQRCDEHERGLVSIPQFVDLMQEVGAYLPFVTISAGVNEPECVIDGKRYLLFSANNYLSLSEDPRLKQAAKFAIDKYGIGPGASRCLAGDIDIIREAERVLSHHVGKQDCLTFPTGYMVNVTLFQALLEPFFPGMPCEKGTAEIFCDELNHGSVHDGLLLTSAKKTTYAHSNLDDLRRKVAASTAANKLIVTEGVYCLEGEIAPLPDYISLKKEFGCWLLVDDAHGVGVVGEHGAGSPEYHSCANDIDLLMGCFDKAFGGTGGYIAADRKVIDYLRIACRSSMFSSALPCSMAAAVIDGVDVCRNDQPRRNRMNTNASYARAQLRKLGFTILGEAELPSIALLVGEEYKAIAFGKALFERGLFVSVFRFPATPQGKARLRIVTMANHTREHLDALVDACAKIGHDLGLVK